jgi:hypothetical protein
MNVLKAEMKRLRVGYLKRARHRNEPWAQMPGWRNTQYLKTITPLAPWFIAASIGAAPFIQTLLLVPGVLLAACWLGFVFWNLLVAEGRLRDREYRLIGRHLLSEEYRR